MKKWMIVLKKSNCILLHYNEEKLKQYAGLIRVPNWIIWIIKKMKKRK